MTKTPPASAKNQGEGKGSDSDLNIPTLGSRVLQEGESPEAMTDHRDAPGAASGVIGGGGSMADAQKIMDSRPVAATPTQAMHNPASLRQYRDQQSETPASTLDVPDLSRSLDSMMRPDLVIEPVPDMLRFKDHAAELAFLEEPMIIRVHETGNPNDEQVVQLGVNGRQIFIERGVDSVVRRKYVEQLFRAKPENVATRITRDGEGNPRNHLDKTRALKYPFSILRDDNPRGRAWERRMRAEG